MYLSFYRLNRKPFEITTDPKFLWLGERHEEALATLRYGVRDNKGFLLLTGDVGTGKTTLINALLKTLDKNTIVAFIRDPALNPIDFFNYTAHSFGMEANFTTKVSFLIQFERFLHDASRKNKRVLLIIDEAQRISQTLLDEVRVLSNIEREDSKLLNIFFIGQLEFNDILLRPENKAIRQRITINYTITALSEQETGRYIKHRLEVAGAEEEILSFETLQDNEKDVYVKDDLKPPENMKEIFTHNAVKAIYSFSKGYPRLINIICDRCLLTGFVEESPIITPKHVWECEKELTIPESQPLRTTDRQVADKLSVEALVENVTNVVIPPQKSLPESEISNKQEDKNVIVDEIPEHQENGNKSKNSKNLIIGAGILLFLIFCYSNLSKNGTYSPQKRATEGPVQNVLQQTDREVEVKELETKKTLSPQRATVVERIKTNSNQEEKVTNKVAPRNKAIAPEKNKTHEVTEKVVENFTPQEQVEVVDSTKRKKEINTSLAIVSENIDSGNLKSMDSGPKADNASPADTVVINSNPQLQLEVLEPIKRKKEMETSLAIVSENKESRSEESINSGPRTDNASTAENVKVETEQVMAQEIVLEPLATYEKLVINLPENSNLLPVNSLDKLNVLAESLLAEPSYKVMITGFTDSVGIASYNKKLSEFRANNVKSYLVGKGVAESRIATQGLGSDHPIASNDTFSGRRANRRVEIEIIR